ncbi:conjugal transfer protein TraG, partial [Chryseobacterium mucoviscidosis]
HKAIKTLPDFTVIHKQDWYIKESYAPDLTEDNQSFLAKSYQRHFNERPFLNHYCYLFLTKTTKERMRMQSNFSSLCKGTLIPKEIRNKETIHRFMEAVAQFERIVNDSGFITQQRLS